MFIDNLRKACFENGTSPTTLLRDLGMSTSSVTSWKKGTVPSVATVYKLARALGVSVAQLLDGCGLDEGEIENYPSSAQAEKHKKSAPILTDKDERDIARTLEGLVDELEQSNSLMFDGEPMSDEAKESIIAAMRLGLQAAKLKNKERFTPKKYGKE